jgi:hypothetical protein
MRAGLEGHVEDGASRALPRVLQCDHLGVGTARPFVPPLPNDLAACDDDSAY